MDRNVYKVTLKMESYVAEPYWPELDDVITIQKKSGCNRAKSEVKREESLRGYLKKENISMEKYEALVKLSQRKWYKDANETIIVPRHHLAGCLVNTVGSVTAAVRGKFDKDSFRHYVRISDFFTAKKEKDSIFDRYVKSDLTNQRRRHLSEVITDFEAVGEVEIVTKYKLDEFKHLLTVALEDFGVGACRKMGYGRGKIESIVESN